ncbi:MAG: metallophosphoesterase [Sporolactobacillus sp.]
MKVLIVSDTHGLTDELTELKARYRGEVAAMIHCGDSELAPDEDAIADFIAVEGNCDRPGSYPEEQIVRLDHLSALIVHGHLQNVKASPQRLLTRAAAVNAQIVCHGHTHCAGVRYEAGRFIVNPGSLSQPRNYREGTYVVLEETEDFLAFQFYNGKHERVPEFSSVFPR